MLTKKQDIDKNVWESKKYGVTRLIKEFSQRPLPGARSMDPVDRNRFRKSSTPRLLHFFFENSLINRVTLYFFDSQTFFINILLSFVNIKFLT